MENIGNVSEIQFMLQLATFCNYYDYYKDTSLKLSDIH